MKTSQAKPASGTGLPPTTVDIAPWTPDRQMLHRPLLRILIRAIFSALLLAAFLAGPAIILILTSGRIAM
ncbi:hypothetical protein [Ensifer adhaerens]|uniref:hypothetical protein n=1 Tax=Ensifer adhaerens TaxID=106592 RepID=UPI000CF0FDAC|nr:hypothetical protein [Ensifer adhaerens]